jgi:hypothetical protein
MTEAVQRRPLGDVRIRVGRRPGLESARVAAQALRTRNRGDYRSRRREQRTPGDVEIVAVVIACNQHRVDRSDVGGGDRRPR